MRTLTGKVRAETREKGSRFIATAFPARGAEEASAGIEAVRSEFPDATHHAWAYVLSARGPDPPERHHDAGEPAGTAGPPILQAIRGAGLCDAVVVVTRYFGGIKLGRGGLARAYRAAASSALAAAATVTLIPRARLRVSLPIALDGEARHIVARHGGHVESAAYDDPRRSVLDTIVPRDARGRLENDLKTLAHGDAAVEQIDSPAAGPSTGSLKTSPA